MFQHTRPDVLRTLLVLSLVALLAPAGVAQVGGAGQAAARGAEPLIPPAPTLDAFDPLTTFADVTLSGAAPRAVDVEVQGPLGTQVVPVVNGAFVATVALEADAVNHVWFTSVSALGARSATTVARVTRDNEAPTVFVDSPADGAEVTLASVDVAGRVADRLSGYEQLEVTVNGIAAVVEPGIGQNGTFLAADVPLQPAGVPTLVTATATDALGNEETASVFVTRVDVPPGSPELAVLSGDGQTGAVGELLAQPLVAVVTRGDGSPFAGKVVTFVVSKSDGVLAASPGGQGQQTLQVAADAAGHAAAWYRLGSDAGCGNNRVVASSTHVLGTTVFHASAVAAPPKRILVGTGGDQVGEVGGPSAAPLRAWVTDGCNGVAGTPVTFTVVAGGGLVGGAPAVTIQSTTTGHVEVPFTFGPAAGPQRVEADFPGNPGLPATFVLTGLNRTFGAGTSFAGLVLDNAGRPLTGAACSIDVASGTVGPVFTDEGGAFLLEGLGAGGPAHLHVDGGTVTEVGGQRVPAGSFPSLGYLVTLVQDARNALPMPVALPPLDPVNQVPFDNTQDAVLSVEGIAGLEFRVAAGSVTRADGTVPDAADPIVLSVNQVQFDDIPMPLPDGAAPPFAWTLQPGGTRFDPPVEVTLPNMSGLPPGSVTYFLSYDHGTERFDIVASGSVAADGATLTTDPGAGIARAGWGGFCPPYPDTTEGAGSDDEDGWGASNSFFGSFLGLTRQKSCSRFADGTIEGYMKYRECVADAALCAGQVAENATSVPGTSFGGPISGLGDVVSFLADEGAKLLEETFGGGAPRTGGDVVEILSETARLVPTWIPGLYADFEARITFAAEPPGLEVGAAFDARGLEAFGFSERAYAALVFVEDEAPGQWRVAGHLIDPDLIPQGVAQFGARSAAIPPFGRFSVPNVPANGGAPLRPLLIYEGADIRWTSTSDSFLAPVDQGTTEFGYVSPDNEARVATSIAPQPASVVLPSVGESVQLAVTGNMDDGSSQDVTPFAKGSVYTTSLADVATVDPQGLVTGQGEGLAMVTISNEGTTSVVPIFVLDFDRLTTVEGFVELEDGTPVADADVTVSPGSLSATTDATGRFSIPGVPTSLGDLSLFVDARVGGGFQTATVTGIAPVEGGITDAGILVVVDAVYWVDDVSGAWSDPARWSTGAVPGPGDHVVVDRDAGEYTVSLAGFAASVRSLRCREVLDLDAGSLALEEPFLVNHDVLLGGATVLGATLLPGPGAPALVASGGTLDQVRLDLTAVIATGGELVVTGGLELRGSVGYAGGAQATRLTFAGAQTLSGSGVVALSGNNAIVRSTGGALTLGPDVVVTGTGTVGDGGSSIVQRGTILADAGQALTVTGASWVNEGDLVAQGGGTLTLEGNWSNQGAITVDASTVDLGGSFTLPSFGSLSGSGATVNVTGALDNAAATLVIDGAVGTWNLVGGSIAGGAVNLVNGAQLEVLGSSQNLLANVVVNGDLNLAGSGSRTRLDAVTLNGTAHLSGSTASLGFVGDQTWSVGTIAFEGTTGGTRRIEVTQAGTLTLTGAAAVTGGNARIGTGAFWNGAMTLVNELAITADLPGETLTFDPANGMTNLGTLSASSGCALTASGMTNDGSVQTAGGTVTLVDLVNQGTVAATAGGVVELDGSWSNGGTVSVTDSTLNLDGSFSTAGLGSFTSVNGVVNVQGALDNAAATLVIDGGTGTWNLAGGSIAGGTVDLVNGAQLEVLGNSNNLLANVVMNGDLNLAASGSRTRLDAVTLNGTAHLSGSTASLGFVGDQTWSVGTIAFEGTTGGTRRIEVTQAGTLTLTGAAAVTGGNARIGTGAFWNGAMTVVNELAITADLPGETLTFDPANGMSNAGTLAAASGCALSASGLTNTGSVQTAGGTVTLVDFVNQGTVAATAGGVVELDGTWSNGGTVSVTDGTLNLDGSFSTAGIGSFTSVNGVVNVEGALDNTAATLVIDGGTGTWNLAGGSIAGGTVDLVNGAQLEVLGNSNNLLANVVVNGDLNLAASGSRTRLDAVTLNGTAHLSGSSANLGFVGDQTWSVGTIAFEGTGGGARRVSMAQAGTLTLTGSSAVTGGRARIGTGSYWNSAMSLVNDASLAAGGTGTTLTLDPANGVTNTGTISSAGGTLVVSDLVNSGTVSGTGGAEITLDGAWSNGGTVSLTDSTLNLEGTFATADLGALTGANATVLLAGALDNAGSTLTIDGASTPGVWALDGGSIVGGTVDLLNGAQLDVRASSNNLLAGVVVNGDLDLASSGARTRLDGVTLNGTAHLSGSSASLGFVGDQTWSAGTIAFEGTSGGARRLSMTQAGTLTLTGTAAVTGSHGRIGTGAFWNQPMTLVNDASLTADSAGKTLVLDPAGGTTHSGALAIAAGAGLNATTTFVQQGAASSLVVDGDLTCGQLDLLGGVLGGSGSITGDVVNTGGRVAPGTSAGELAIAGSYEQGAGGTLEIELGGLVPVAEHDRLAVTGAIDLDGTLEIVLIDGFSPSLGDGFQALTQASRSGLFATLVGADLGGGLEIEASYATTEVTLEVVPAL